MSQPLTRFLAILVGLLLLAAGVGGGIWHYRTSTAKVELLLSERHYFTEQYRKTQELLATATATITSLETAASEREAALSEAERLLRYEQGRNEEFARELKKLSGTVGVLDKLAKTDEELLQKYSKVYFLNENYRPERLTQIPTRYIQPGKKDQYFHASAWRFLKAMIDDAAEAGVTLQVVSAFRSFEEQNELKGAYTQVYGSGANAFSADQGFSEHQLGTAVDLTDPSTAGTFGSFANTEAYSWLRENAHKYGFILSYPEDNTFYIFEPWHWRFVGEDLARDLHRANAHFYDWDQRKIDEYLVSVFD